MKTERCRGADLTIVADVGGADGAPPILFMHGGGQTRHSWKRTARRAVERGYRVISIDLRGHGESDWAQGAYRLYDYVADARALAREIGQAVAVVGASLGGLTGLMLAGEEGPSLVRALVPHAEYVNVEGADHMIAGDRNDAFNDAVFDFLDRHQPP